MENGTIINQYKIISPIGKGGMGEVYLAEDTKLHRKVALKFLPAEFAEDADRMNRFVREAQSASALNHPNIITIYEIGESEGTHFIATEFIDGKTLSDYVKANPLDDKAILEIAIQVASALDEAHSAGIVHRDIKPDNVMVRANGLAKILDFGIAKLSAPTTTTDGEAATAIQAQTQAGMIIGTPNYMSPEQARGRDVDSQTDIFSFGVVLYEMLSGASPFKGETVSDVIAAVLTKEAKPLADVPPELAAIVQKSLQKDKQKRYKSAKDLLDELKEVKQELAIQSRLGRNSAPNLEEPKTPILKAQTTAESETQNSIAVLPFTNMSADEDNEYFCEGLAEELLNALSKIEDLKVAARTSAFSFKDKNANVSEIGEKLSVKNVLGGSVRRSGNRLRISVQLINAADGYQIWSERYDRELKDIFDVQDEIALAVVDALKVKLFGNEKAIVLEHYTDNTEAYQLYLKGRYQANKFTREGFNKAIEYFNQALTQDPNFALVYVGMADAYYHAATFHLSPREAFLLLKDSATKALELDASLAETHTFLALFTANYDHKPFEAEAGFKRGVELGLNNSVTHQYYGLFLAFTKRFDESIAELQRAQNLDPLSLVVSFLLGWAYYFAKQPEKMLEEARKSLEIEPNFWVTHWNLALGYEQAGQYTEALASLKTAKSLEDSPWICAITARIYAKLKRPDEARKLLDGLTAKSNQKWVAPYMVATAYLSLNEREKAFEWLDKAFDECDEWIQCLNVDPALDALRLEPRFQTLVQRMGFPIDQKNKTDESLEAKTAMLSSSELKTELPADAETQSADSEPTAERPSNAKSEIQKPKSKWWLFGLLGLIVLVGGFFGYKYFTPNKQIESIAVMPFVNESGNADVEYLSDGMTETLISSLSNLPNLNVKPRSSVFRYKGKDTDLQTIGKELNVQAILNGRVVQRGEDISLFVELTDISLDKVIWSETYKRKQSDLVTLQTDIARDVSSKLKTKLSGADVAKVEKTYTTNSEAYQLYLKGRYQLNQRTAESFNRGIEFFRQAIERDPNFAVAYAGLADAYNQMGLWTTLAPSQSFPKAKAAAEKALQLDDTLAEAHTALAFAKFSYEWDFAGAEREYQKAISLNPNYAFARELYGFQMYRANPRRFDEAMLELKTAQEIDPLSLSVGFDMAALFYFEKHYDKAIEQLKAVQNLEPNFTLGYGLLGAIYREKEMYDESVAAWDRGSTLEGAGFSKEELDVLRKAYKESGFKGYARKHAELLQAQARERYVSPYFIAMDYAMIGEKELALEWLDKAYKEHSSWLIDIGVDPVWDILRDDPRFKDLLKRMNLPE